MVRATGTSFPLPDPAVRTVAGPRWFRLAVGVTFVGVVSAVFAHYFRDLIGRAVEAIGGSRNPTVAAVSHARWVTAAIVAVGVLVSSEIAWLVKCRRGERIGLEAIADAARGEGVGPNVRCTLMRALATFVAMASMASLGREAPILETGGSVGAYAGRKLRLSVADLAIVGVSAAFAAAYHAPVAAVFYVREHVVPGASRRATVHAVLGGAIGMLVSTVGFGARAVFPRSHTPIDRSVVLLVAAGVVPAYLLTRGFFELRRIAIHPKGFVRRHRRPTSIAAALVAGALVALVPLTSGNGMDLIRHGAVETTLAVGLVMAVTKLVATLATLAAGAPGGVFSPSLAIAAGTGLVVSHLGALAHVGTAAGRWDVMLALMAVAVAVGAHAPLVAVFVVPELSGDARLLALTVPVVIATQGLAYLARRVGDRRARRRLLDDLDA